ncbi:MAG TPA: hypothetical protein VEU54_07485 [Steroidobacteraceae bacterium]|jgi:hypothetical protein|nr:hypothetical protein [Steroidobacteraceae bacterium]
MKGYLATFLLSLLLSGSAYADLQPAVPDGPKQPRTLGQRAVLHIYYYSPQTLEITYVDSYFFKDEDSCKDAIGRALLIATPYAGGGDLVNARCVGMTPPEAVTKPRKPESADGTKTL